MSLTPSGTRDAKKAVSIVRDAGGRVVGRTRLQKIAYLLELTGLGDGFAFEYRHYGPYSEELSAAIRNANLGGLLVEDERPATWGGYYSIFTTAELTDAPVRAARRRLVQTAAEADPIELELVSTAAFLFSEGKNEPWEETARRKPKKADDGRLEKAKKLYQKLRQIETPVPLPDLR